MKDLFLISAYTPDNTRKDILRNLVKSVDKDIFDIMVVSHSSIPTDIIESVDYFIYDAKNILLTDIIHKYTMYYSSSKFDIISTENRTFNHSLAVLKLITLGLSTAKNEGYTKVHCIEYDVEYTSNMEFIENSKLLDDYNLVYYKTNHTPAMIAFPVSFHLDKISKDWFIFDLDYLIEWITNSDFKTMEDYELELISKEKAYKKPYTDLSKNGIIVNIYFSGDEDIWVTPVINENNQLLLFGWNKPDNLGAKDIALYNIKAIVNNTDYYNWDLPLNNWNLNSLGNYDDINNLTIIRNGKKIINYDFNKINKDNYKMSNYLTLNG